MGAGIDYGRGTDANTDTVTGIRYGIINQNSLMPEALDDIYTNGDDIGYVNAIAEAKAGLKDAIYGVLNEMMSNQKADEIAEESAENIIDDLDGDCFSGGESGPYEYEQDGYQLRTTSNHELFVIKSDYYTLCRFCSPCFPGAGNLDQWDEDGVKTYCLDGSWFDKDNGENWCHVLPYRVYRVSDDSLVSEFKKLSEDDE